MHPPFGPFVYCPYCASPLERRQIPSGEGPLRGVCPACGFVHWGNPKASSSGIVLNADGKLLLTRRAREPFKGWWDVPGGFLEADEHPEAAVCRELEEETGLIVTIDRMVGVYMDTYGPPPGDHTLNFYYVCRLSDNSADAQARDDVQEVGWFDPRALPQPIAFENARAALRDWLQQEGISGSVE